MSQLFRITTVPPRPGHVSDPARAGLKAAPVSSPHEGLKTKVRPIATGARVARPASTVLAYLACRGAGLGLLRPGVRQAQHKEEL